MRRPTLIIFTRSLMAAIGVSLWLVLLMAKGGESILVRQPGSGAGNVAAGSVLSQIPMAFEPNKGQVEPGFSYIARGGRHALLLGSAEGSSLVRLIRTVNGVQKAIDVRFPGSNPEARLEPDGELQGRSSYFLGDRSDEWLADLPNYERIAYREIYPGVDLVFYGRGSQLEYDFIVAPGADPSLIRMEFDGATGVSLDGSGDINLEIPSVDVRTAGDVLQVRRPTVYQGTAESRRLVAAGYRISGRREVSIDLAGYDRTKPLVVDPIIDLSTFLGGSGQETGYAVTVDTTGNIYIVGQTSSLNFPAKSAYDNSINGTSDAFIVKINPTGTSVLFSTYLGGRNPGDKAWDVEVDRDGRIYVCGETLSLNFPIVNAYQGAFRGGTDGFISILSSNGAQLLYSSYLGGSSQDVIYGMALDADRNIYLTGGTKSSNFPVINAIQPELKGRMDSFVTKLNWKGEVIFSTFLGGQDTGVESSEEEVGYGIALDSLQNIYLTGSTSSRSFPLVNPIQSTFGGVEDCFIVKLNGSGQAILYSTFLGGSRADRGRAIAVDGFGQAHVTGYTFFNDFPLVNALQPIYRGNLDAFVAKLEADGRRLVFSTYLGGTGEENSGSLNDQVPSGSIAVDKVGNIYVAGKTGSFDFPVSQPTQPWLRGNTDGFLCKIDPAGSALLFSTYIGSSYPSDLGNDERVLGLAVDGNGAVYLTGQALQSDFPLTNSLQSGFGGGSSDAFLTRISMPDLISLAPVSAASYNGSSIAPESIVAIFGNGLSGGVETATSVPLPLSLRGTSVSIEDRFGVSRDARLFFVSPSQINLEVPPGTAPGRAVITVNNSTAMAGSNANHRATVLIDQVAPSIFSANADGFGAPAAFIQRVRSDGTTSLEPVVRRNYLGQYEPLPIDLGGAGDEVYLVIFGTGWRRVESIERVSVRIGGVEVPVVYAGQQGDYAGLDQVNMRLPRQLAGRGTLTLSLEIEGMLANPARVAIK